MSDVVPNQTNTLVKVPLQIIDIDPTKPKVVGQRVTLRLKWEGDIRNIRWTIPGIPVASFDATRARSTFTALVTNDCQELEFHWTQGGTHHVSVTADVDGVHGSVELIIEVKAPTAVSFSCTANDVSTISKAKGTPWIRYGTYDSGVAGIDWKFDAEGPVGFEGEVMALQLTRVRREWHGPAPKRNAVDTGKDYYLDPTLDSGAPARDIAYGDQQKTLSAGRQQTLKSSDGPGMSLEPLDSKGRATAPLTEMTVRQEFWLYLLYRPYTPRSIWVPVQRVQWRWNGFASRLSLDGAWKAGSIPDDSTPSIPRPQAEVTTIYPIWVGRIAEFEDKALLQNEAFP